MALCKFSNSFSMESHIILDNLFVNEYMPSANADYVKVYIYGMFLCSASNSGDNTIENMSRVLNLTKTQVIDAFEYWQAVGLVQIVSKDPIEVRFLPLKENSGSNKKYKAEKYTDFNKMIESFLCDRTVTPNEFNEYYWFVESNNMELEAFLCIVKYCTMIKSTKIGYPYILAVARSFAEEGLKTEKAVSEKLVELELTSSELKSVLKTLGLKRDADPEERKLFLKWTKSFGFTHGVVLYVAKSLKNGGVAKLDATLSKYYQNKLMSIPEIENFSTASETQFELAKEIARTIGVYYQNYDNIVETYICDWMQKGYDEPTLKSIANHCFKKSIRTFEGVDTIVQKYFKLGLVSQDAINQYIGEVVATDKNIQNILDACGILRNVNTWDRDFYRTWTYSWGFGDDIILYASGEAKGKEQPLKYLNKILSSLHEKEIKTLEDAKKQITNFGKSLDANNAKKFDDHDYSEKDLNALFDNLDDVEV